MNKLLVFAALLSVSAAQIKCPSPPVWEGRMVEMSTTRNRIAEISYDFENLRKRIIEEETFTDGERDAYDELFLHKEEMGYRLNLRTKECEKFTLTEPFRVVGVPDDARFDEIRVLGLLGGDPGDSLVVDKYEGDTTRGHYSGEWVPASSQVCLPEGESYHDMTNGYATHIYFYDVSLGIKDPNVFVPPPECQ